jgi:diguanylate cyclase (GGDEF)-like protein
MMAASFDLRLVILSFLVATSAAYVALDLVARMVAAPDRKQARIWLIGGALTMGLGIWAMHFIGMLALSLPIPLSYQPLETFTSLVIAVAVSGFAIKMGSQARLNRGKLLAAGSVMGLGISCMHYVGMMAIPVTPAIQYDPLWFSLSILVAICASIAALWIVHALRAETLITAFKEKSASALVLGLAIFGMHFTGMHAAHFSSDSLCVTNADQVNNLWLGGAIGILSFLFLVITLLLTLFNASIAERAARENSLRLLAQKDALTGLPNRILFFDRLDHAMRRTRRTKAQIALLFLDIDNFKGVNDTLGHLAGDALLIEFGHRLTQVVRSSDTVCRLGGDEFIILLDPIDKPAHAESVADAVLKRVAEAVELSSQAVHITTSIGIAIYQGENITPDEFIARADRALYKAKNSGRNQLQVA